MPLFSRPVPGRGGGGAATATTSAAAVFLLLPSLLVPSWRQPTIANDGIAEHGGGGFALPMVLLADAADAVEPATIELEDDGDEFSSLSNDALTNWIDMDQRELELMLPYAKKKKEFDAAWEIYDKGGYANSVATVHLAAPLEAPLNGGTPVEGFDLWGYPTRGRIVDRRIVGETAIDVEYEPGESCYIGGLGRNADYQGCFAPNGTLRIFDDDEAAAANTTSTVLSYAHDRDSETRNRNTLRSYSATAKTRMVDCQNCPREHRTYQKFYEYYGSYTYADDWIAAAFRGLSTNLERGNAVFNRYGSKARAQAVTKSTVVLSVWMYFLREMEAAIGRCRPDCPEARSYYYGSSPTTTTQEEDNCSNDEAAWHWDDAVALFQGSMVGKLRVRDASFREIDNVRGPYAGSFRESTRFNDLAGSNFGSGVLLHRLLMEEGELFRSSSSSNKKFFGDDDSENDSDGTTSRSRIYRAFEAGSIQLRYGACDAAQATKREIETMVLIPLVRGTLRSTAAYRGGSGSGSGCGHRQEVDPSSWRAELDDAAEAEVAAVETAVYAASVLPLIHACDERDARILHDATKLPVDDGSGNGSLDREDDGAAYRTVKSVLEKNYDCLGIRSEDVGELVGCLGDESSSSSSTKRDDENDHWLVIVGSVLGGFLLGLLAAKMDRSSSSSSGSTTTSIHAPNESSSATNEDEGGATTTPTPSYTERKEGEAAPEPEESTSIVESRESAV